MISYHPIHFFRKRVAPVVRTQTGLYVADAYLAMLSSQSRHHDCGGVTLHQDPIGLFSHQHVIHGRKNLGAQSGQSLSRLHQIQVNVGNNAKDR